MAPPAPAPPPQVKSIFREIANTRKINISIREGRNLMSKDANGSSDPFCQVLVDHNHVFNTGEPAPRISCCWRALLGVLSL
jgi:Ca2+-dependent lipid-binding protein